MEKEEPAVVRRKLSGNENTETKPTLENMDKISGEKSHTKNEENKHDKKPSCKAYTKEVSQWLMQYRTHQWMHYCSQHALMMAPCFFGSPFSPMPPPGADTPTSPPGFPSMGGVAAGQGPAPFPGQQMQVPAAAQFPFTYQQPPTVPQQQQQQQQQQTHPQIPQLTASEFTLPSLYRRITAEIIDFVLLFIVKFGVTLFIIEYMGIVDPSSFMMRFLIEEIDEDSTFEDLQQMLVFALIYRVVVCGYETFFLKYMHGLGNTVGGATPGKYCMGLRVVSCDRVQGLGGNKALVVSPENLTYLQALLRAVIKNFSMAFFFPACITVFFNPHFRAAYDILTRTVVVSVPNWAERLRPQNR
ncbi:protein FAM8A1-like [Asterias rubens]|uniref:protein FAM8A1-like n=1 Tax=Asterias rubens TaxID=7604 RepID=UPI0014556221|nr:protein FAM8A1-like [Asterias rubens]